MGMSIMRVPLDFDHPQNRVWEGYYPNIEKLKDRNLPELEFMKDYDDTKDVCENCIKIFGDCNAGYRRCLLYNPKLRKLWEKDPPAGDGFQIWRTDCEGCPISPVFPTLEGLCTWLENNATTFGGKKVSKEVWMEMLSRKMFYTSI